MTAYRARGLQELSDEYTDRAAKTRRRGARKDYQRIAVAARQDLDRLRQVDNTEGQSSGS